MPQWAARATTERAQVLRTLFTLHLGAGIAIAPVLVLFWALGTLSTLAPFLGLLLLVVAVAAGAIVTAHRRAAGWTCGQVAAERTIAGLAGLDILVLIAAIHLGGGPDATGLPFFVLPAVVFGGLLPRATTIGLSLGSALLLAVVFAAHHAGATAESATVAVTLSRYAALVTVSFLAAAVTAAIGERWRTQQRTVRTLARETGRIGELQARIVSTVSHELRTPLSIIQAAAGSLGRYGDRMTGAERIWRLKKIEDAVQATTRLIEDVLPLGELERGVADPSARRPLATVCAEVVADVRATAPDHVHVSYEPAADLPTTLVDTRLARRVLRDLLSNAIRYSPVGGTVRVELTRAAGNDDVVELRVRDEGIGIPSEDHAYVFEPFYRGANVGNIPGLGVGLSIARREVELMGGSLALEPKERGASFVVALPARSDHQ